MKLEEILLMSWIKIKNYFLIAVKDKEIKKAKGVNKNVVDSSRHEEYVENMWACFFGKK